MCIVVVDRQFLASGILQKILEPNSSLFQELRPELGDDTLWR